MLEMRPAVARSLAEGGVERGPLLGREHVNIGLGEVGQPARVVEVEVGDGDVADVGGIKSQGP